MQILAALAILLSLGIPAPAAGARAYVVASGIDDKTPGSITPFHLAKATLGAPYFVPAGGNLLAIDPRTKQIWEAATAPGCSGTCGPPFLIYILDPNSGSPLATITVGNEVFSLVFDSPGRNAYANLYNTGIVKIDVAARSVVRTLTGAYSGLVFSSDGSKLFTAAQGNILALDPQTLQTLGSASPPNPYKGAGTLFVSGTTLLTTNGHYLLYYDTGTLQLTKEVYSQSSEIFAISPDGSKIYLSVYPGVGAPQSIDVIDFSSGEILASQTYTNTLVTGSVLSPDGTRIVALSTSAVVLIDPATLAITTTITPAAGPIATVFLDPDTMLMLNPDVGAMMVIDQSSATVTATFPLGPATVPGEVADPERGVIYVGSTAFGEPYYYTCCNTSIVNAKLNRMVGNLPLIGFVPVALGGGQLYTAGSAYNLATGVSTHLPPPVLHLPPGLHQSWLPGAATPDGQTYWSPYYASPPVGRFYKEGIAVYSTATNTLVAQFETPLPTANPIAFSPDSATAYVGSHHAISVYDTATYLQTATFVLSTTFITMAVSPDGRNLYGNNGEAVFVLDASTGAEKSKIELPDTVQGPMDISPDGTTLFLTDSTMNTVDLVTPANGAVTVVPVPYAPTSVVVLP